MFPFKSRAELQELPERERFRYLARMMWILIALEMLFGLQLAFLEGFRTIGLALVALGVLSLVCPLSMTLLARRLARERREGL
ncbi:MAG TPA: hypothetical protein VGO31_14725 [Microbacteriaceae bacterium]|nr:hypothetical protein [Microbacteriaceae bacterium]